jgi:hypothetical protein
MATHTTVSRIRHDSDATFQEWVSENTAAFAAAGLVQTADTGQINPGTATRPAVNTSAGYQIWRFNDTLQGTFPIFIRVEYRTGSSATVPAMFMAVGTTTNGAGTLGGVTYTPAAMASMSNTQVTDTLRSSYWSHTEGSFGMLWKHEAATQEVTVIVSRTFDPVTGAATGDGILSLTLGSTAFGCRVMKVTSPTDVRLSNNVNNAQLCHWPMILTNSSFVGADPQVALAFIPVNRVTPAIGVVGVRHTEFPSNTTFSFTPLGSTSRTYLALSGNTPYMCSDNYLKAAMLWE